MSDEGLGQARSKMLDDGVDAVAVDVFAHYYRMVESGETGMIPESTIEPVEIPSLADVDLGDGPVPTDGLASTVVVKLNGGLGTSMGLDRAKSLLEVRDGLSFLDIIARQVLWAREEHGVTLPLVSVPRIFWVSLSTFSSSPEMKGTTLPRMSREGTPG